MLNDTVSMKAVVFYKSRIFHSTLQIWLRHNLSVLMPILGTVQTIFCCMVRESYVPIEKDYA